MDSVSKIVFLNLKDINALQLSIMKFVDTWVSSQKTIVPKKEIIKYMEEKGTPVPTILHGISILVKRGYIRRAVNSTNKASYVQIRKI